MAESALSLDLQRERWRRLRLAQENGAVIPQRDMPRPVAPVSPLLRRQTPAAPSVAPTDYPAPESFVSTPALDAVRSGGRPFNGIFTPWGVRVGNEWDPREYSGHLGTSVEGLWPGLRQRIAERNRRESGLTRAQPAPQDTGPVDPLRRVRAAVGGGELAPGMFAAAGPAGVATNIPGMVDTAPTRDTEEIVPGPVDRGLLRNPYAGVIRAPAGTNEMLRDMRERTSGPVRREQSPNREERLLLTRGKAEEGVERVRGRTAENVARIAGAAGIAEAAAGRDPTKPVVLTDETYNEKGKKTGSRQTLVDPQTGQPVGAQTGVDMTAYANYMTRLGDLRGKNRVGSFKGSDKAAVKELDTNWTNATGLPLQFAPHRGGRGLVGDRAPEGSTRDMIIEQARRFRPEMDDETLISTLIEQGYLRA